MFFWRRTRKKIDSFVGNTKKDLSNVKHKYFLGQLNFIIAIPKLIKFHGYGYDVNYVFLKKHFSKVEDKAIISEFRENLNDLQQEFDTVEDTNNKFVFNIKTLYIFGSFVLDFLTEFEFRKKIIVKILEINADSKNDDFENVISPQFIENKSNNTNWSGESLQNIN